MSTSFSGRVAMAAALSISAGFAQMVQTSMGPRLGWRRPRNTLWRDSPERKAAAEVKRIRKAAVVRQHVERGAYGLLPHAGTKGYVPNYPIVSARGVAA